MGDDSTGHSGPPPGVTDVAELLEGIAATPGDDFLRWLASHLTKSVGCEWALVWERRDGAFARTRVVAASRRGEPCALELEIDLAGTPCEQAYRGPPVVIERGLRQKYPGVAALESLGGDSYVSLALHDGSGRALGHVSLVDAQPLADPARWVDALKRFQARVASELARRRTEDERRRAAQLLLETHQLESLGVLAGGVAHEFNNLLIGILGHTSLALAGADERAPERIHLVEIEAAARRAADLARQMVDYSGRDASDVQPLDLSDLVEQTERLLRVTVPENVELVLDLARDLPAVRGEATQLRQALLHLVLHGARTIGKRNGVVRVTTGRRIVDLAFVERAGRGTSIAEGEHVFVEVADSGRGSEAESSKGPWLAGLQAVARAHRGALTAATESGGGSTFRILLPASGEPVRRADAPAAAESDWSSSGLVLIVDDEELVRTATARMLERLGFTACTAADGQEGLRLLAERGEDVRLVLLDAAMPRLSGEEAIRAMRRARPHVPIVLTSGYSRHEATHRLRDTELAGFLPKPFGLRELSRCLREALSRPDVGRPEGPRESAAGR